MKPKVYTIQLDGNAWIATNEEFINLQESTATFGDTPVIALERLIKYEQEISPSTEGKSR